MAEMWIGAHPAAPSVLPDGRTLDEHIRKDPVATLGPDVARRFGDRLPFLMKLLASGEPLSLQVHPTSERARIRFEEQEAADIPLHAPERSYQDRSHKPELIYALTRFEGLAGFRDPARTAVILRGLGLPWLDAIATRLESAASPFQEMRAVVTELLATPEPLLSHRLEQVRVSALAAEQRLHATTAGRRDRSRDPSAVERESIRVYAALPALIERYPHDAGVLVTLLLNHVVLAAGEAMFIDAGVIHAYTSGFGVEVMASSDNVLRAGLTPKHVDVPELLEITNFTPIPPPLWLPSAGGEGAARFRPPVAEFQLFVGRSELLEASGTGPRAVLVLEGTLRAVTATETLSLKQGEVLFVGHRHGELRLEGNARVAVASVPI
ncbi:mannose-6-phosphate isomerase, class I [Nocardioides koreensis]|uniref:mannose-6-phosphate isomerase n=1 Tax=Nocardioides koreensis TaxID=433651 RepID=A0ABN2Z7A9_9ACTN